MAKAKKKMKAKKAAKHMGKTKKKKAAKRSARTKMKRQKPAKAKKMSKPKLKKKQSSPISAAVPSKQAAPPSKKPKCLVLTGFGLHAEVELAHAFTLAGADAHIVHFSDISSGKTKLSNYQVFAIPGGWAYADELGAGKVLANKLKSTFRKQFEEFAAAGKPVIGICNGFQVLVKLGALPNAAAAFQQEVTLTQNASGRFEDRWVYLAPQKSVCKYLEGVPFINCPVRHGEGRLVVRDEKELSVLERKGLVVLKYADEKGNADVPYPANPNGSPRGIAGICDPTGKIFALMPHPEVAVRRETYPRFTSGISYEKNSIRFFQNVVKAAAEFI